MRERITEILRGIIHPETGENLVDGNFAAEVSASDDGRRIRVRLRFRRANDPFGSRLVRQTKELLAAEFPASEIEVEQLKPAPPQQPEKVSFTGGIRHIVAVASGKGGVGKSTVTANIATALRDEGYRVGVLDADIYGPSQPKMFGCEGFVPEAEREGETDVMIPAEVAGGIKLMSIGFFVSPNDALLWRGPMATSALRQLIHQTRWGELDYLLIDLPPGTGDIHLSIITELKIEGAVIVSTPQQIAVADVARGVELFRNANVNIPVIGVIENMAWFTPAELPDNRYYIFGHGGAARYAAENGLELLGEIPLIQSVMESADSGRTGSVENRAAADYYRSAALKIVEKCG